MKGIKKMCKLPYIDYKRMDDYVFKWIMSKIADTDEQTVKELLASGSDKAKRKVLQKRSNELNKNIDATKGKIDNVVSAIANGTITQERAKGKMQIVFIPETAEIISPQVVVDYHLIGISFMN